MKQILLLIVCTSLLFCGCSKDDDNKVQVSREYQIRLAYGQNSYVSTKSPNIEQLEILLKNEIEKINKQFGAKFTITARDKDEQLAYEQCDAEAVVKYEAQRSQIIAAMEAAQAVFNAKERELAPSYTEEEKNKYYIDNFTYGLLSYETEINVAPGYLEVFVLSDKEHQVKFVAGSKK